MRALAIRTMLAASACRWLLLAVAVFSLCPTMGFAAKDPEPSVKIPLAPLGYPPRRVNHELAGTAMFTLNFVDNTHLLFTYTAHGMLLRIPDDPVEDEDRNVEALLLELPSGKVVSRTVWRLHDYGQFLWELGGGRFLLRVRNQFTTLAPLADPNDTWARQPLFQLSNDLIFRDLGITQDHGVMVVQMSQKPTALPEGQRPRFGGISALPVVAQFMRLLPPEDPRGPMHMRIDTAVQRQGPTEFSVTSTGFMQVRKEGPDQWGFDYREFSGKQTQLAGIESSCTPFPVFISSAEFVTFGCRGSVDRSSLTGFNMAGDISWSIGLDQAQSYPSLSTAPEAGRFAISRSYGNPFHAPDDPAEINTQEVRVLQNYNGKQLLRVECSPLQASGQNFTISPDGMQFAVMQDALVVYPLPPLSKDELKALAISKAMAPKAAPLLKVDLTGQAPEMPHQPASTSTSPAGPVPANGANGSLPSAPVPASVANRGAQDTPAEPDPADAPRKPPSLLGP